VKTAGWLLGACTLSAQSAAATGSVAHAITPERFEGVSSVLFPISGVQNVKPGGYHLAPSNVRFEGSAMGIRFDDYLARHVYTHQLPRSGDGHN
jgi:hypothetical protein